MTEQEEARAVEVEDPFALPVPEREVYHKEYRDPRQPGVVLALSLCPLGTVERAASMRELMRMTELYVRGRDGMPPGPFPLIGGKAVPVSPEMMSEAVMVAAMQAPPELSRQRRRWAPEQLVAWSVTMPFAWRQVMADCQEIADGEASAEGNSCAPTTA